MCLLMHVSFQVAVIEVVLFIAFPKDVNLCR